MNGTTRYTARQLGMVLDAQGRKKRWLAAQVGVHESLIGHMVTGRRSASEDLAKRISDTLGLPLFLLFEFHEQSETIRSTEAAA